jgi:chaperonin GroES
MNINPLGERIVIKALPAQEVTKSGIVLPSNVEKERSEQGEVIAVGPGKLLENGTRSQMNVKIGDKILFKKYTTTEIKLDGTEYLIVDESDVLATIQ